MQCCIGHTAYFSAGVDFPALQAGLLPKLTKCYSFRRLESGRQDWTSHDELLRVTSRSAAVLRLGAGSDSRAHPHSSEGF